MTNKKYKSNNRNKQKIWKRNTTTCGIQQNDFFEPDCPFKDRCISRGHKCNGCKHNKNSRDDFYEPKNPKSYPWYPKDPYNPWKIIWR